MQTNNIEDEANELIFKFQRTFFARFGVTPVVHYNLNMPYVGEITIAELATVVDDVMNQNMFYEGRYATILTRTRKRPVVFYRHVFCHLALELRYSCSHVGKYLNMNHSSVIHSRKLVANLLEVKDQEMEKIMQSVQMALCEFVKSKGRYDTILQQAG